MSKINLEVKLRRLDWFWCRSTLLNNQKGERLQDQRRSSCLQLNFRTLMTENLYTEGDGPLTHLKTSSALFRHHGMVISCGEKQSWSVKQHFLCNVKTHHTIEPHVRVTGHSGNFKSALPYWCTLSISVAHFTENIYVCSVLIDIGMISQYRLQNIDYCIKFEKYHLVPLPI